MIPPHQLNRHYTPTHFNKSAYTIQNRLPIFFIRFLLSELHPEFPFVVQSCWGKTKINAQSNPGMEFQLSVIKGLQSLIIIYLSPMRTIPSFSLRPQRLRKTQFFSFRITMIPETAAHNIRPNPHKFGVLFFLAEAQRRGDDI